MLSELRPPAADVSTENIRNRPRLNVTSSVVDDYASAPQRIVGPKVSLKISYYGYAEIIEFNVIEMTFPDMPEKNELTKIVIWGLTKCARASDSATAVVKPISSDMPALGRRGQLPARGSYRSGHARFGHPAPRTMASLRDGKYCEPHAVGGADSAHLNGQTPPTSSAHATSDD